MTTTPFFSVILPTHNRATFIGQAIDSILLQSFTNFELIIIDDGSTDNTKEVVSAFNDKRIFYHYQENQERSIARNNGIKKAQGQYICFLDSDDYYLPNHLAVLYENIKNHNYPVALFHTYQTYKVNGQEKDMQFYDDYKNSELSETDCRLINNVWLFSPAVQTIAVHKDICSAISFNTYTIPFECYEYVGNITALYTLIKIKEKTVIMLTHENNSTSYNVKYLEDSKNAFTYILSNPIYKNIKNHFWVKNKFYFIYIGLADCYSRSGNRMAAINCLFKALSYKTNIKNIRHLLGITKNIITPKWR